MSICLAASGCVEYGPQLQLGHPWFAPEGSALEAFAGLETTAVDVIVFADTSGSMAEELQTLGAAIQPFVEALATEADDWQLAAVTGDTGCSVSGLLTPTTPDYASRFAQAIVTPVGNQGSSESGLQNVTLVVENAGPGTCNDGLLRAGSVLQLVFVSDENEESPGYDESPGYWAEWIGRIGQVHGDPSRVKIAAVSGPVPDGCPGADPGFGYAAAVDGTGGALLSICEDWAAQIDIVADAVGTRSTFPLAQEPLPHTIEVWVEDDRLPVTALHYEPLSNSVLVSPPVPADLPVWILYELLRP